MSTPPPNDINKLIPWVRTQKFSTKSEVTSKLSTHKSEVESLLENKFSDYEKRISFLEEKVANLMREIGL